MEKSVFEQEAEKMRERERQASAVREAAGMGFWRLVSIVVVGILLSQAINALVVRVLLPLWSTGSLPQ